MCAECGENGLHCSNCGEVAAPTTVERRWRWSFDSPNEWTLGEPDMSTYPSGDETLLVVQTRRVTEWEEEK